MRTAGVLAGCRGGVPRRHSPPRAQARDACATAGEDAGGPLYLPAVPAYFLFNAPSRDFACWFSGEIFITSS